MTALLVILSIILIAIVAVQIGRVSELAAKVRGEEEAKERINITQSRWMLLFMVVFLVLTAASAYYYKNYMLGFGPHVPASAHGHLIDDAFWITTVIVYIVFVLTHIALFWFAYKYRQIEGRKAEFIPHNNTLEIVWMVIPAVVMTYLVIGGLDAWNTILADVGDTEDVIEVEAMGYQFAWNLRYAGPDGKLGSRDYRLTTGTNPVGQDWTDESGLDDIQPTELWLPVVDPDEEDTNIRVKILARDVLHDFYLPHFRVKMDAVPGMPTYFVFKPTKTTEEYRQMLRDVPEYNIPDPNDPEKMLWETFEYELACAELCGTGHWSMRKLVKIVSKEEYEAWLKDQKSYYMSAIYGTDADPWPIDGRYPDIVVNARKQEFTGLLDAAMKGTTRLEKTFVLPYVTYETDSAQLTQFSKNYELKNVVEAMKQYPDLVIELGGHTDNVGDPVHNQTLSQNRAQSVYNFLVEQGIDASRLSAVGFGETQPLEANDSDENRAKNRRTEFTVVSGGPLAER